MAEELIKIPEDRIAVLVGTKGKTKRKIQKLSDTKITINSEEGEVKIEGEDSLRVLTTRDIVKAIGRGFNPEIALKLLEEDKILDVINIKDYSGKSKKKEERLKSRIIGTQGKAKQTVEDKTYCDISIYGKTVAVIGDMEKISISRRAIEMILHGSQHGHVYKWIDEQLERDKQEDKLQ